MNKGEFKKAMTELEEVDIEDSYVSVLRVGLMGDCQSELKKYSDASAKYEEAANMIDNDFTTPLYLRKAAGCAQELKDFKKATVYYKRIMDDYPQFAVQNEIERYHAYVSNIK
jgi:tetratricopeptide (TPR) repeat protein